jgi:CTP:molybdopterin cytidylyltransferase MocA
MTGERATVILPCAGAGRRLGLPFGKELLPLGPGSTPLDAALGLLLPAAARLRLVVVLSPEREATARHILRTTASWRLPVAFTCQQPGLAESTGAVLSAEPWYSERNLVLLPDQVLTCPPDGLVTSALEAVGDAPFCFLASRETDPARISRDGALAITASTPARLLDYAEHPALAEASRFNAVWFGFAFRREHAGTAVSLLHRAVTGETVTAGDVAGSPLGGCAVIDVGPYRDLGTWPAVMAHWGGNATARKEARP